MSNGKGEVSLTKREYDQLVWRGGVELKDVEVGDELILRVTVTQVQASSVGRDVRICIEDASGMLAPIRPHTIISHFPMNAGPVNVTPALLRPSQGGQIDDF